VDDNPSKLAAATAFGATDVLHAEPGTDVAAVIRDLSGGGVEYAFEVVGTPETVETAFDALCPGGMAVVVGLVPEAATVRLDAVHFLYEKTITGSLLGSGHPHVDVPRYVDLYREGRIDLDSLVSHRIGLDDLARGFADLAAGGARRIVVDFSAETRDPR
jgi:S-(hydroxymethyl)glutathione dehydrogenase/alcohol dehydrogenase